MHYEQAIARRFGFSFQSNKLNMARIVVFLDNLQIVLPNRF